MKYMYTSPDCPRCDSRKEDLKANKIPFTERDATRLTAPAEDQDDIDIDALAQLSMQNNILPVEVEIKD